MGLLMMVSCNEESETLNEILRNERLGLVHDIDSMKNLKNIYIHQIDSVHNVMNTIMANQESRERNDMLITERKSIEQNIKNQINIHNDLIRRNTVLKNQINQNEFALSTSKTIYIVKIKIHQTTFTLDPGEYIKNKWNDVVFEIPVDKAYYDKSHIGQTITDPGLKIGSLIMNGDFSKLRIKIVGKRTVKR